MRAIPAMLILGICGASPLALADGWRAVASLQPESAPNCRKADLTKLFFDFTDNGSELSVKTSDGHNYSAPIADDGSVKTTVSVPLGFSTFSIDVSGNAKTRELEAFNQKYACKFKLAPIN